jgi:hypothetical protein
MFCISGELKMYQGSKGEWIGSFPRQDMGNLVPRLTLSKNIDLSPGKTYETCLPATTDLRLAKCTASIISWGGTLI